MFGWNEKDLLMGSQQRTLFDGGFGGSRDVPEKKKEPVAPKVASKSPRLDDFF